MFKRFKDVLQIISYETLEEAANEYWTKCNVSFAPEKFRVFFNSLMAVEAKDADECFSFSSYEDFTFEDDDDPSKTETWEDVTVIYLSEIREIYKKYGTEEFMKKHQSDVERINAPYDPELGSHALWFETDIRPTAYSMVASPWNEILGTWMVIEKDETVSETARKAALVLYEITFFGKTEEEREEELRKLGESLEDATNGKTYTLEEVRESLGLPEYKGPSEEEKRAEFEVDRRNVLTSYEDFKKLYFNLLEEGMLEEN